MQTTTALQLCLVLHLTGLVLMAGMSVADAITWRSFWKEHVLNKQQAMKLLDATAVYQKVLAFGAALLLITGVGMMYFTHGVFGEQLWMRIKISIVVLIIINGPVIGRIQGAKLKKALVEGAQQANLNPQINILRNRVNVLSVLNIIFLITIIVLSVFKFN